MYVPSQYRAPDSSWMLDLLCRNPLALMVTNGEPETGPHATHLPVIPDRGPAAEWPADLAGATLLGHMNRANPHWRALADWSTVLLVFTGPHAYVSPTVYQVTPAAPTWNFTSVHVHGRIRRIESRAETLDVIRATVSCFEREFGNGWDMSGSIDYFQKILPGVGAFHVTVSHAEGMFKLSQEQAPEVRERVRLSFAHRESTGCREAASLMGRISRDHVGVPT
jgi:transcriptional regulator